MPHFLPPLPPDAPLDRRGLAEWTVSRLQSADCRVTVNRMWSEIFGTGLVETTEDFGVMGGRPSHPELLDWLALDFRENGWDVKRFYKQLVMSATYRQSARSDSAIDRKRSEKPPARARAAVPHGWRDASRHRVGRPADCWWRRLAARASSPTSPPECGKRAAIRSATRREYVQDHGDALYRRSLYTFWKRMATMPDMDVSGCARSRCRMHAPPAHRHAACKLWC